MPLRETIRVAVIQTTLDNACAWNDPTRLKISIAEENRAISEIGRGFTDLHQNQLAPDIVLLPELAVPRGYVDELARLANSLGALVIAGVDYSPPTRLKSVMNEGVVIVPRYWGGRRSAFGTTVRYFAKTYPAEREREAIENQYNLRFKGVPTVWVLNSNQLGRIGVCICYDLLDLCRLAMYRGHIQHLMVLAYNEDLLSFQHVAEAAMRTIYCNVVVYNTGKYGGSLAIAPLHDPNRRILYQQMGAGLFDCQVFELSVQGLAVKQASGGRDPVWKSLPPGYMASVDLRRVNTVIRSRVKEPKIARKRSVATVKER